MKIAYCIDSLKPSGGTERVLTTKVNWLCLQPEIEVYILTLQESETPFFPLNEKVNRITLSTANYQKDLEQTLYEIRPDVTIAVAGKACTLLPQMKDGSKKILEFHYTKNFLVNFVSTLHHIRFRKLHLMKMKWMQWRLAQLAKRYDLFVGLTARDVTLWGNPRNMTYVYNPLSFRSKQKSTCTNHKIIAVGSFTPVKGMDQLIKAFAMIASKYPGWSVDIYGSGQEKGYLEELIAKYNLQNQVYLFTPVSHINEKLIEASIYAFPSRSDGFGLVITEAMECGLPTVAMDCPCGPREIVTSDTGIVVPDRDIKAFAFALEELITDETKRKEMGMAASKNVVRFYPENIMPRWIEIFNKKTV